MLYQKTSACCWHVQTTYLTQLLATNKHDRRLLNFVTGTPLPQLGPLGLYSQKGAFRALCHYSGIALDDAAGILNPSTSIQT
eukprot:scaffold5185_cov198-Alexandrium_tamarense.AAC.43